MRIPTWSRLTAVTLASTLSLTGCFETSQPPSPTTTTVPERQVVASTPTTAPSPTAAPTTAAPTTATPTTAAPTSGAGVADECARLTAAQAANPPRFHPASTINRPAACYSARSDANRWATNWFRYANFPGRTDPSRRGHIQIAFDEYSTPVYRSTEATTRIKVFTAGWSYGSDLGSDPTIPWNPSWNPAGGTDLEMVIIDEQTGREWSLWGVQKVNWTGCLTLDNLLRGYRPGTDLCTATAHIGRNTDGTLADAITSNGFSKGGGRGMGSLLGMALLPTLDEIERGSINHAINMETYGTMFGPGCTPGQLGTAAAGVDCGYAVAPATRLEWHGGPAAECGAVAQKNTPAERAKTVPEGMRFTHTLTDSQIDSWLNSRGYTGKKRSTARIFAVALRDYGWIISDTTCWGSSTAVEGVANPSARRRWESLGITNPTTDGVSLLEGLITAENQVRVVESPNPTLFTNAQ